jgi:phage tail sheath protein FI
MPSTLTYPGVYVEEIPSGVRTIVGVSTSNTAFVDYFARGPLNRPVRITSVGDFDREFGGLDPLSEASYAIRQYYQHGGQIAFVVRALSGTGANAPQKSTANIAGGTPSATQFTIDAVSEGKWGDSLQYGIDQQTAATPPDGSAAAEVFNLVVREIGTVQGQQQVIRSEVHRNLSINLTKARYAVDAVAADSKLVTLSKVAATLARPDTTRANPALPLVNATDPAELANPTSNAFLPLGGGNNGLQPDSAALETGMNSLDQIAPEIFNILSIPRAANLDASTTLTANTNFAAFVPKANKFCADRRAFFIVDIPPKVQSQADMTAWMNNVTGIRNKNAAIYFPRIDVADPLNENRPRNSGYSGTLAGLYAATDAARGVWKAPAGTDVAMTGASLRAKLTDLENGALNPFGINVLRTFPIFGNIVWGARTLDGADAIASEWKYIPVRRTALFIEESLFQGLKWVVFEPNDDTLWAQIRLNVGAFLHNLFRQGAFQGNTPSKAYFVKCDSETTTQNDIDLGVVNIVVGFAPLKPAEFVVIKIQQIAGQIQV